MLGIDRGKIKAVSVICSNFFNMKRLVYSINPLKPQPYLPPAPSTDYHIADKSPKKKTP